MPVSCQDPEDEPGVRTWTRTHHTNETSSDTASGNLKHDTSFIKFIGVLNEIQESETVLKAKMGEARNEAHLILGGPPGLSLPSIHTATNTSPPSMSRQAETLSPASPQNNLPAVSPMTIRIPSLKRQRSEHISSTQPPQDVSDWISPLLSNRLRSVLDSRKTEVQNKEMNTISIILHHFDQFGSNA